MTASSEAGAVGSTLRNVGAACVCSFSVSAGMVSSRKGSLPLMSWNKMTPSAQMSVRTSTSFVEIICSGDM